MKKSIYAISMIILLIISAGLMWFWLEYSFEATEIGEINFPETLIINPGETLYISLEIPIAEP